MTGTLTADEEGRKLFGKGIQQRRYELSRLTTHTEIIF